MVNKANDIYNRWSEGEEVQTVLQHVVSNDPSAQEFDREVIGIPLPASPTHISPSPPPNSDPFQHTHKSLAQCILEVHERARTLFPHRKPCSCSTRGPVCPPSHFWAPPPIMNVSEPVLPDLHTDSYDYGYANVSGMGGRAGGVLPRAPTQGPHQYNNQGSGVSLSPTLKMGAIMDTLNFELGALKDQGWMSFF